MKKLTVSNNSYNSTLTLQNKNINQIELKDINEYISYLFEVYDDIIDVNKISKICNNEQLSLTIRSFAIIQDAMYGYHMSENGIFPETIDQHHTDDLFEILIANKIYFEYEKNSKTTNTKIKNSFNEKLLSGMHDAWTLARLLKIKKNNNNEYELVPYDERDKNKNTNNILPQEDELLINKYNKNDKKIVKIVTKFGETFVQARRLFQMVPYHVLLNSDNEEAKKDDVPVKVYNILKNPNIEKIDVRTKIQSGAGKNKSLAANI